MQKKYFQPIRINHQGKCYRLMELGSRRTEWYYAEWKELGSQLKD